MSNRFDLTGEKALVTGAGGRLGQIWVQALEEAGAIVYRTDTEAALRTDMFPCGPWGGAADITNPKDVERLLSTGFSYEATAHGLAEYITILVNNAGVDDRPTAGETWPRYELAEQMCRVNLLGTYMMTNAFGERMVQEGRGTIINIASLYGLVAPDLKLYSHLPGFLKHPMYGATKAGIVSLTKYFAAKYGPSGVRVNALAPGGVVNPGDGLTGADEQFKAKYTAKIPMGRMCTPEDLAGPLVFLASKASSFITGQTIAIDGGFTAW